MYKHKIRIPKSISKKQIIKYFNNYNLDILIENSPLTKKSDKLSIMSKAYSPELEDLYRLHEFIIINKRLTILEFGCGWSSLVMLNALIENKKKYLNKVKKLRYENPFEIFVLDNEKKYLDISKKRIKKFFKKDVSKIKFIYSEISMNTFNNRICNTYKKLPNINPDLIYLDGPDQLKIKNSINGINIKNPDFMPMNADILFIEPFLRPGTIIISDGRTANFRFLCNNLQRNWYAKENQTEDQHILYLNEEPLGKPNKNQLKFYYED